MLTSAVVLFVVVQLFGSIYDYPHRKILIDLKSAWSRSFANDISDGDGGVVVRMAIWRSAIDVIRDHPILGVGLGYEEEHLTTEYKEKNVPFLIAGAWNAHNQLLSYLINFGVLGFGLLAVFYLRLIRHAYWARCRVYFGLIAIFACVAVTESLFNRLLGISLFAFFNSLIMLKLANNDK